MSLWLILFSILHHYTGSAVRQKESDSKWLHKVTKNWNDYGYEWSDIHNGYVLNYGIPWFPWSNIRMRHVPDNAEKAKRAVKQLIESHGILDPQIITQEMKKKFEDDFLKLKAENTTVTRMTTGYTQLKKQLEVFGYCLEERTKHGTYLLKEVNR